MKKLCLGTFLKILSQANNTKQYILFENVLSFLNTGDDYSDEQKQGAYKSGKNNLANYYDLVTCDKDALVSYYQRKIIPCLKRELHKCVVLAIRDVLKEDNIDDLAQIGYDDGYTKQDIINKAYFNFAELLANVFYYCVIIVTNQIPYKENIKEITNGYVASFSPLADTIEFEETSKPITSKISYTLDPKRFASVFKEISSAKLSLPNNNDAKIYSLEITNARIDYGKVKRFIRGNIGRYVYSRAQRNNYELNGDLEAISSYAIDAYRKRVNRNPDTNHFSEIMLYSFLECILGAPKIFSKMELQNKSGQFETFASGIHVLSMKKGMLPFNQLVLGASDTYDDLENAVNNAFIQIERIAAGGSEEYHLLEESILNNEFDADMNRTLESMIVPNKTTAPSSTEKAYGVFLGYTINIDGTGLSNEEYLKNANDKMTNDIKGIIPCIESKIKALGLSNHSFYIYILPLNDALNDKEDIIKDALGVK